MWRTVWLILKALIAAYAAITLAVVIVLLIADAVRMYK